jgi:hypothetical protein
MAHLDNNRNAILLCNLERTFHTLISKGSSNNVALLCRLSMDLLSLAIHLHYKVLDTLLDSNKAHHLARDGHHIQDLHRSSSSSKEIHGITLL